MIYNQTKGEGSLVIAEFNTPVFGRAELKSDIHYPVKF
jgi:hypothetical protein